MRMPASASRVSSSSGALRPHRRPLRIRSVRRRLPVSRFAPNRARPSTVVSRNSTGTVSDIIRISDDQSRTAALSSDETDFSSTSTPVWRLERQPMGLIEISSSHHASPPYPYPHAKAASVRARRAFSLRERRRWVGSSGACTSSGWEAARNVRRRSSPMSPWHSYAWL